MRSPLTPQRKRVNAQIIRIQVSLNKSHSGLIRARNAPLQ